MSRLLGTILFLALLAGAAWAQSNDPPAATSAPAQQQSTQQAPDRQKLPPPNQAPPRAPRGNSEESSSSDTKIDLSPPGDDNKHPGAHAGDDVSEFHVYDPHKAEKDVEVGDFYFKRKNYAAAIARYRSALNWKPNDAIATFRLAQGLERMGQIEDAREQYQAYLKILPNGPNAPDARSAVQRLTLQSESRRDGPEKRR
jgi:tetratricopeptide (TPR) repeat protein